MRLSKITWEDDCYTYIKIWFTIKYFKYNIVTFADDVANEYGLVWVENQLFFENS